MVLLEYFHINIRVLKLHIHSAVLKKNLTNIL